MGPFTTVLKSHIKRKPAYKPHTPTHTRTLHGRDPRVWGHEGDMRLTRPHTCAISMCWHRGLRWRHRPRDSQDADPHGVFTFWPTVPTLPWAWERRDHDACSLSVDCLRILHCISTHSSDPLGTSSLKQCLRRPHFPHWPLEGGNAPAWSPAGPAALSPQLTAHSSQPPVHSSSTCSGTAPHGFLKPPPNQHLPTESHPSAGSP